MKCFIPGLNVKILGRAIHALAKIGDELYLESLPEGLVLKTINAAESAYSMVVFGCSFFTYYKHDHYISEDGQDVCMCKISMKSAMNVFKSPAHMDKQVESCELKLDPETCKLVFQLKCKYAVVKTHYLPIQDCKRVEANFTKDMLPNRLSTQHKVLSDAVSNFQTTEDQITIEVNPQAMLLRNYTDNYDTSKIIRTQISLKPAEFDSYSIGIDTNITFTMREFRAILSFAEALNLPLSLQFETTGKPAIFVIENNTTFEANFVMATEPPEGTTQQTAGTTQNVKQNTTARKRNSDTLAESKTASKKVHLESKEDMSRCLDEDSHLFNFIEMPDESALENNLVQENVDKRDADKSSDNNNDKVISNGVKRVIEEDFPIPDSPICNTQVKRIRTVFKRCFEATIDPRSATAHKVLAEDSDNED